MASTAIELDVGGIGVRLSNPDKIYFADLGLTKRDIAEYAMSVGDGLLAGLFRRPTTLERWPAGVAE
ncbi:MAG: ATP-dependent DNA ligase, partial [Brooklawnia sp.]